MSLKCFVLCAIALIAQAQTTPPKTSTAPTSYPVFHEIPAYCGTSLAVQMATAACPQRDRFRMDSAPIATSLPVSLPKLTGAGAPFKVAAVGTSIDIQCASTDCSKNEADLQTVKSTIDKLSAPFTVDLLAPRSANDAVVEINETYNPALYAYPLRDGRVRLFSGTAITSDLKQQIQSLVQTAGSTPVTLPQFCLSGVLDRSATRNPPPNSCQRDLLAPGTNASQIASAIQDPNFTLTPEGNNRVLISCKSGGCLAAETSRMAARIRDMARPSPAYIRDLPVPNAPDIAAQINAQKLAVTADAIGPNVIRLKSDIPVSTQDVADLTRRYLTLASSFEVALPYFCLSGNLSAPPTRILPGQVCLPPGIPVQTANGSTIATALGKDPTISNIVIITSSRILVTCKTQLCSPSDTDRITMTVEELAWPSPAFVQYEEVPEGAAATIAQKITGLNLLGIGADAIGTNRIRLRDDTAVTSADARRLIDQYIFGSPALPAFRMFYQLPSVIIPDLIPSASGGGSGGTAAPAAAPASTPSSTTGSGTSAGATTIETKSSTSTSPPPSETKTAQTPATISVPITVNAAAPASNNAGAPPGGTTITAPKTPSPPPDNSSNNPPPTTNTFTPVAAPSTPPAPATTTTTTTTVTPPAPPTPPATPPAAPPASVAAGMTAVNDNVVFTDTSNDALTWQRIRLLTLLDLPRPEVLMNVWSYQASSPDGNEVLKSTQTVRDLVSSHNDALENSIQYGWAYLSRMMKPDLLQAGGPPAPSLTYFDHEFYDYITQKFVVDPHQRVQEQDRAKWGFCPVDKYCLGFTQAFQPVRPNLTSLLLGAIASAHPLRTILTTIGCMEGKYEVYAAECFPERREIETTIQTLQDEDLKIARRRKLSKEEKKKASEDNVARLTQLYVEEVPCTNCQGEIVKLKKKIGEIRERLGEYEHCEKCEQEREDLEGTLRILEEQLIVLRKAGENAPGQRTPRPTTGKDDGKQGNGKPNETDPTTSGKDVAVCLRLERRRLIRQQHYRTKLSCDVLDAIALQAQEICGVTQTLPLSCLTIEAVQSFSSPAGFSTFTLEQLNELAEVPLANTTIVLGGDDKPSSLAYGTSNIGLLRAAVADFLFNYKMSQQFPQDFVAYDLQHSAQELNAELNPLVVAFNQDVAAFSQHISDKLEGESNNKNNFAQFWRNHNSFLSDGIITVRGIGSVPSSVNTTTQSFFDATQAQSLSAILNNFTGQGATPGGGTVPPAAVVELADLQPQVVFLGC